VPHRHCLYGLPHRHILTASARTRKAGRTVSTNFAKLDAFRNLQFVLLLHLFARAQSVCCRCPFLLPFFFLRVHRRNSGSSSLAIPAERSQRPTPGRIVWR